MRKSPFLRLSFWTIAAALLVISVPAFAGVTISSPANGSTVTSPTHFVASATGTNPITYMHLYIDGKNMYGGATSAIDWTGALTAGSHTAIVQAWDVKGVLYKSSISITVSTTSAPPPTIPPNAVIHSNMDEITGWKSCDACSGKYQNGPVTPHTATYGVTSPSLDGKSMQLWIGGTNAYGSALWWKGMGQTTARHYTTDLYFYLKNPAASQAMEFDIYQDLNARHFVLGVECSLKNTGTWRVYDTTYQHWRSTTAPCTYFAPYTWHHLITEQESTADGHSHMIALTIDGQKYYLNKYYGDRAGGTYNQATIGLQLDGNSTMTAYAAWYDKVTVSVW
jgi:Big-like domain-containing protein